MALATKQQTPPDFSKYKYHSKDNLVTCIPAMLAMLSIFLSILLCFPFLLLHSNGEYITHEAQFLERLHLPATGPESIAFDATGGGPYTGISDGRILKYVNASIGFLEFAITSPNRSKELCVGNGGVALDSVCGRPFGLGFHHQTGDLYIADAYHGLMVVGPKGGVATQLANAADGVPFGFTNALDIDTSTGMVYFVDYSSQFSVNEFSASLQAHDMTGRLMKYNPESKETTVLLGGLGGAAGMAVSKDCSFILITEAITKRIRKFWLEGPKANTWEILKEFTVRPANIKRNAEGEFWVAFLVGDETGSCPSQQQSPGLRITGDGMILEAISLDTQGSISEVAVHDGKMYIGSPFLHFVDVYAWTSKSHQTE